MADVDTTLKSLLSTLGVKVYALRRPSDSSLPCLVYRRVGEKNYISHSGATDLSRYRIQITHVASTFTTLRSLVKDVKTALIGNVINFNATIPTEIQIEDEEAPNVLTSTKDYLIYSNL